MIDARLNIRTMKLADLKPAKYNPRKIDDAAMAGLEQSMTRFGVVEPIIFNARSGVVVGGHQRLKVLRSQKVTETDVVVVELDEIEEKALNVALNSPHISGEFTADLQAILEEVMAANEEMFHSLRLGELLGETIAVAPLADPDDVPDVPSVAITQPGDVYVLGSHRLVCGDATSPSAFASVLGNEKASISFTSPPYNAGKSESLSGNTHSGDNKYGAYDDDKTIKEYGHILTTFTIESLAHASCVIVNLQMLAGNKKAIVDYLYAFRDHVVDVAIWDKGHGAPQMAANVLTNQFEFLVFLSPKNDASRAIPGANFHGTVPNVYSAPPQRKNDFSKVHAATFPVHLPEWVLTTFSQIGAIVIDCFGGTGTTMIAAEMTGRRCRMIELDPLYCDVIVQRWQTFTGKIAVRQPAAEAETIGQRA